MTIAVVAQYSDSSGFLNTLTPTVSIVTRQGTSVSSGTATFITNGIYQYTFTYQFDVQYIWTFDGGSGLSFAERYVSGSFSMGYSTSGALTPGQDLALNAIHKLIRPIFFGMIKLAARFNIDLSKLGINIDEYK